MKKRVVTLLPETEVCHMTSVYEILDYASNMYKNDLAYIQPEGLKDRSAISFKKFKKQVDILRQSLISDGYKDKHFAIIGETSIEWVETYLAVISGVGVAVPIDKELSEEIILSQLEKADIEVIVCSCKSWKKVSRFIDKCSNIKQVFIMRGEVPQDKYYFSLRSFVSLININLDRKQYAEINIDPDKLCTIIFTSGTTGTNKGVSLSNKNILATLKGSSRLQMFPLTSISLLPINHAYELHVHLLGCLYCGTTVFLNDDVKHMLKNIQGYQPKMSCMVPMMLDMIMHRIKSGIEKSGKKTKFEKTVRLSNVLRKVGIDLRYKLFSEVREPFGGQLEIVICGGAALSQDTIDFYDDIGVEVYNGYGITECSPVAAVNPYKQRKDGTVGYVLPNMKARIADIDENGNGEIELSGDNVMLGYYNDQESTDKVLEKDGWFKTGDIGHIDNDGYLYITGRLKNLIILPNGENIYPEEIEERLMHLVPEIKECVIVENNKASGLYALIYPDPTLCKEKGLNDGDSIQYYLDEQIKQFNSQIARYKRIGDFEVVDKEFEKSTTQKILRHKVKIQKGN